MWQDYLDVIERFGTAIAPLSPLLVVVIGAMIAQRYRKRNTTSDAQQKRLDEQVEVNNGKLPTVQQIWDEQRLQRKEFEEKFTAQETRIKELERSLRQKTEDEARLTTAFTSLRDVFLAFAERVRSGGSMEFTLQEHRALELQVVGVEDDLAGS